MDRRGHYFANNGPCVWCKATEERVQDRKAPPFCPARPDADEVRDDAYTGGNWSTGY